MTINIDVTDNCFNNLIEFEKLNIGEILKQKKVILKPFELEKIRGEIVAEAILENENKLLIGFALKSCQDLKTVLELLRDKKAIISRIYFDNGERRKAATEKYKKDYSLHSRWLDYSPEYVEHAYNEFDKKIEDIKKYSIKNKIELRAI